MIWSIAASPLLCGGYDGNGTAAAGVCRSVDFILLFFLSAGVPFGRPLLRLRSPSLRCSPIPPIVLLIILLEFPYPQPSSRGLPATALVHEPHSYPFSVLLSSLLCAAAAADATGLLPPDRCLALRLSCVVLCLWQWLVPSERRGSYFFWLRSYDGPRPQRGSPCVFVLHERIKRQRGKHLAAAGRVPLTGTKNGELHP